MKKLSLILFCTLLLLFFIAFNYLLWERQSREKDMESLRNLNVENSSKVYTYERQVSALREKNDELNAAKTELEEQINRLSVEKVQLDKEKQDTAEDLERKERVVDKLKQQVDLNILEEPIKKWVEFINKGDYDSAYQLQYGHFISKDEELDSEAFSSLFEDVVKSVSIKSIELFINEESPESSGNIIFAVILNIEKQEAVDKAADYFRQGENTRYFTIDYDFKQDIWVITSIDSILT